MICKHLLTHSAHCIETNFGSVHIIHLTSSQLTSFHGKLGCFTVWHSSLWL